MIRTTTRKLTLDIEGASTETEVEVSYTYAPPCRGLRERGTGVPLEPDYGPEIDVRSIVATVGKVKVDLLPLVGDAMKREIEDDIAEELETV